MQLIYHTVFVLTGLSLNKKKNPKKKGDIRAFFVGHSPGWNGFAFILVTQRRPHVDEACRTGRFHTHPQ